MDLLSEVFSDLIKDLDTWSRKDKKQDSKLDRLRSLKETLQGEIDTIDTEIRLQEQDESWNYDDEMEGTKNYE